MTSAIEGITSEQPQIVHLELPRAEAEQLQQLLPRVRRALEDQPDMSVEKRQRRQASRATIDAVLTQLAERLATSEAAP